MYHYFLIKAICDMLSGLIEIWYPLYAADNYKNGYLMVIWYIYLHKYSQFNMF
jgi:hypothetical protein